MCRWLAYSGPPLAVEDLLFRPQHSLIRQSLSAWRSTLPINGDGFGLGWYGSGPEPGLFRDTLPAWHDDNLRNLSRQIVSPQFLAHVRASSGSATSRENCHPFRCGDILFVHNGFIGDFHRIRRKIELLIPAHLFGERRGATDSEAFFLLALANGLADDVAGALRRTVAQVLDAMAQAGDTEPFHMTAAIADGRHLHALRFSNDIDPPSLYFATGARIGVADGEILFEPGKGAVLILSEPLDNHADDWTEIPAASLVTARDGAVEIADFAL